MNGTVTRIAPGEDGRSLRGRENRRRIVAAMLTLVGGGNVNPSAEEVAAEAQVGLRTVFRHFEDMDSLYSEMSRLKAQEIMALADHPIEGAHWRDRLAALVARRAQVFERMLPFKGAADLRRHRSAFLQTEHVALNANFRSRLLAVLPRDPAPPAPVIDALDLLLSFDAWRRLRRDQNLDPAAAEAALTAAARALADGVSP